MIASILLGTTAQPTLAVTARFYYPYPDKRVSYRRIYTIDWNGQSRRLISLPGQDCGAVMWAGKNRLVYEVENKTPYGTRSIWTTTLPSGKPKLLSKSGYLRTHDSFMYAKDGTAVIESYKGFPQILNPKSGKLEPFKRVENGWIDPFNPDDKQFKSGSVSSANGRFPVSFSSLAEGVGYLITNHNEPLKEVQYNYTVHDSKSNRLWIISHEYWRAYSLSIVRWDTGKIQKLFVAGKIDWRPDRNQTAFVTQPDLSPYGPTKKVWSNELWVGDLGSGAERQIKLPLAFFTDVAVSPK